MEKSQKYLTIEEALKKANDGQNQNIKGKFVGQHVFCNVNTLAEYVLNKSFEDSDAPFSLDDIENYYFYPEYRGEYASFDGGSDDERQTEIKRLKDLIEELDLDSLEFPKESKEFVKAEQIETEIEALEDLETEPAEIFEWWAVSEFLYRKLKENGYCVVEAGSCYLWGRTTTGQAILLDGVISRICANMEILEGQNNSWA